MKHKEYDVFFCGCGRIHYISRDELYEWCVNDNRSSERQIIHVCRGCGATLLKGFDNDSYGLSAFAYPIDQDTKFIADPKKHKVIVSQGIRIPMQSGGYADDKRNYVFVDEEGLIKEIGPDDLCNVKGAGYGALRHEFKDVKSINVDMKRLMEDVDPDVLESMCGYSIPSFDWIGTPYEKPYHRR